MTENLFAHNAAWNGELSEAVASVTLSAEKTLAALTVMAGPLLAISETIATVIERSWVSLEPIANELSGMSIAMGASIASSVGPMIKAAESLPALTGSMVSAVDVSGAPLAGVMQSCSLAVKSLEASLPMWAELGQSLATIMGSPRSGGIHALLDEKQVALDETKLGERESEFDRVVREGWTGGASVAHASQEGLAGTFDTLRFRDDQGRFTYLFAIAIALIVGVMAWILGLVLDGSLSPVEPLMVAAAVLGWCRRLRS